MSTITVARTAGFCFGVDRAVKIVYDELEKKSRVEERAPILSETMPKSKKDNQSVVLLFFA